MEFKEYQIRATSTDQTPKILWGEKDQKNRPTKEEVIPLIGMVGEVGGLLSEYGMSLKNGQLVGFTFHTPQDFYCQEPNVSAACYKNPQCNQNTPFLSLLN